MLSHCPRPRDATSADIHLFRRTFRRANTLAMRFQIVKQRGAGKRRRRGKFDASRVSGEAKVQPRLAPLHIFAVVTAESAQFRLEGAASATCSKPGFVAAAFEGLKPLCKRSPRVVGAEPRRDRRRRDYARCPQRPRPACRATQRFDRSHHSRASWARRQANRRRQRQRSQAGIGRCFQDKVWGPRQRKGRERKRLVESNVSGCRRGTDVVVRF
jgi:hypothetical protein